MTVEQLRSDLERLDGRLDVQVLLQFRDRKAKYVFGSIEVVEEHQDADDRNGDSVLLRCDELLDSEL
jgi:hypothetical protein